MRDESGTDGQKTHGVHWAPKKDLEGIGPKVVPRQREHQSSLRTTG